MLRKTLGSKPATVLEFASHCGRDDACSAAVCSATGPTAPAALSDLLSGPLVAFRIILAAVAGFVLLGEWSGFLERSTDLVSWPAWIAALVLGG